MSYFDAASGTNILVASVKDCQGKVLPPNQVIYEDAFDGLEASVRYTYTRGGFEQDIILLESPPLPEAYGLASATTRLVVMTEFLNPPEPAVYQTIVTDGAGAPLPDDTLDFGALHIGAGSGFLLGPSAPGAGLKVYKQWAELEGRQFLLEQVPAVDLFQAISSLPRKQGASLKSTTDAIRFTASTRQLPSPRAATGDTNLMQLASRRLPQTGYVLDYVTMPVSATNYLFQGSTTYYISGAVTLAGTNTWEGRVVLKFAANAAISLARPYNINPQIVFLTKPFVPVVCTAKDDNSVGETISGSTGNPSGYYANPALGLSSFSSSQAAGNLRIAYAQQGISLNGLQLTLSDAQFVNCGSGVQLTGAGLLLRNALFCNTLTNFNSPGGASIDAQNVTFSGSVRLVSSTSPYSRTSLTATNCVFANVTYLNAGNVNLSGGYNGFFNAPQFGAVPTTNAAYPFQAARAGAFYLADDSSFRNAGTPNIDTNLLANLHTKTTCPPMVYSNATISSNTVFSPHAQRDTDTPDLGYHYDPLDYAFGGVTANANLTFTPGTAVGWFRTSQGWYHAGHGIRAADNTTIAFNGTLEQPCYWVTCSTVQEQLAFAGYGPGGITAWTWPDPNAAPRITARFTRCGMMDNLQGNVFRDDYGILALSATDCEFYVGGVGGYNTLCSLTNCLFDRMPIWLQTSQTFPTMVLRNCTMRGGSLVFSHSEPGPAHSYTSIRDTIFDGVVINTGYPNDPTCVDYDYNAFLTGSNRLSPPGVNDKLVSSFNWQTSWLGNYYLPTNSPLINTGSVVNAGLVGLFHYTTQTNQLKETNSVVDIGYHCVAVDANGLPIDTNGDGVPDYLADGNGDGLTQTNEIPWNLGIASQPQNTTVVQGADASFSVVASGAGPFTYQWRFNGTNIAGATNSTYAKIVVLTNDGGNYSVVVANGTASIPSSNALLTVFVPLTMLGISPTATNCVQGSNVTFQVQVTGTLPAYQWYFGSTPLTNSSRITGANAANLAISNLSTNDLGYYKAVATNLAGSVTSLWATLNVSAPISLGPLLVSPSPVVQAGDTTFRVTASDPSAAFQWQFQSNNIIGANVSNYSRVVMQPSQDAGRYSVTATNQAGPVSLSTNITVLVPPLITAQPANVQTNTGATVAFSVGVSTNSTTPLSYRWYFNQTNLITWATNYLSMVTLTNVQNTNSGWYSVLVSNLVGTNWSITAFLSLGGSNGVSTNSLQVPNVTMVLPTNTVATNAAVYPYSPPIPPIALRASATVTDPGSYITQVAFYGGTNLSLSDSNLVGAAVVGANATYAFRYTAPPLGTNWARAVAWDSKGRSNASPVVYYIMNKAPAVTTAPASITLVWQGFTTNAWFTNYVSDDGYPYRITNIFWSSLGYAASLTSYTNYTPANIIIATLATFTNYGLYTPTLSVSDGNATTPSTCWITLKRLPYVQITRPTNNAVFLAGTPVGLNVTAYAQNGGSITNVVFYNGTNVIGTAWPSIGNTFALAWTNAPLWTNVLTAVARDSDGLQSTSAPVTVTVLPYLYVWINSPTNNQILVTSPTNILLIATPTSYAGGGISSVNFYNGASFLGAGTPQTNSGAYQFLWQNVTNGTYTVGVQASDSYGNTATNSVTFTVNAMPLVSITSPTNLATFREVTNITLRATAWDVDGTNINVQFWCPTGQVSGVVSVNNGTNFSLTWSNRPHGVYPVTATATDNRGAVTVSPMVLFKVTSTNPPPTVNITWPTNGAILQPGVGLPLKAAVVSSHGVSNVAFFQNSILLASGALLAPELDISGLYPGTYQFMASATDTNGLQGNSQPVTVTVEDWPPLPASGYWDPAFHPTPWGDDFRWDLPLLIALDSSNAVYTIDDMRDIGSRIHLWQPCGWTDSGLSPPHGALAMMYHGTNLFVGGDLSWSGQSPGSTFVATWNGSQPNDLTFGLNTNVWALDFFEGQLLVGGDFTQASNDTRVQYLAQLVGSTWLPIGNGLNGRVRAIASIGNDLYVGGDFTAAGGDVTISNVAKLSGTNWVRLGSGLNDIVRTLAVWNGQLLVGGDFTTAGGFTNANCLAVWDGFSWGTIQSGVSLSNTNRSKHVAALAVRGNDVFVGGQFDTINGTTLQSAHVVHARWDVPSQSWVWSPMDLGVANNGLLPHVDSLAIRPSPVTNAVDVIAAGYFNQAGSVPSIRVARWIMGNTDCTNANLPSVSFNWPQPGSSFSGLGSLPLDATADPAGDSQIASVTFYDNGTALGGNYVGGDRYQYDWTCSTYGVHKLDAVAVQTDGFANSATVYVTFTTNNAPALTADQYIMFANDPPTPLYVLTNDTGAIGISGLVQYQGSGAAWIAPGRTKLLFQPAPNTYGTILLSYSATNGQGISASTFVTVTVRARPVVQINNPPDGTVTNTSATVVISGTSFDVAVPITNVTVFVNGATQIGQSTNPNFGFNWTNNTPGFYTFVAVAAASDGTTNDSLPVTVSLTNSATSGNGHLPVAAISYPTPTSVNLNGLLVPAPFVVRDGQITNFTGSAYDPDATDHVAYQVLLLDPQNPDGPPLYNVTPGPLNAGQFHDLTNGITNGSLGPLDLSVVENGTYLLTLLVRGGGDLVTTNVLIGVDTSLKIGQFSFSEQDLVLPVNGIPLTVTRTYNSLNPRSADFGYGWTFALNSMDVVLDDEREDVTIGSDQAPLADVEEGANGLPLVQSIRTNGGWDVTLTLPDGRRTTFAFTPTFSPSACRAYAHWTAPSDVHATLEALGSDENVINLIPYSPPYWQKGGGNSTFDNHDIAGWVLTNLDGTAYYITRGASNNVVYYPEGSFTPINVRAYGPPQLTKILQRTGDEIHIGPDGISHWGNGTNLTRRTWFERDPQGRITAIRDPISGSNGTPVVKYIYNQDTGNLIQVLKLTDRAAGLYVTNKYYYEYSQFRHYITRIENGLGVPIAQNYYDSSGRLTSTVDANGNTTQFIHNLTNSLELVVDPRGNTNTFAYDSRGNVTATTNALNGVTLWGYDDNNNKTNEIAFLNGHPYATNRYTYDLNSGLLLASVDPLGFSNTFAYNEFAQVTNTVDARGAASTNYYDGCGNLTGTSAALGNSTTNFYDPAGSGLLFGSRDALGNLTTNTYDSSGNLRATALLQAGTLTVLSTNSFGCDSDGNRTNSVTWRRVGGNWVGATNTYFFDGQNRVIQTIESDGYTNLVVYDSAGRQYQTIDKLSRVTTFSYDGQGRLIQTRNPDQTTTSSAYDCSDNRTNSVDQLGRTNTYVYDAINRLKQTIFADNTASSTVYDDLGRVLFSVDARGVTNAFGYDEAGHRTAVTNAWGVSGVQMTNGYTFDGNGNQWTFTDGLGRTTTNVFDLLNRSIQVWYPDGTKTFTGYDAGGRRAAQTNQDGVITRLGYDGAGRLTAVTNAYGPGQFVTQFQYDEAGNESAQIDALNRTNTFGYDALGRRTIRTLPSQQSETFGYDPVGNLLSHTDFNGLVITNQYTVRNQLWKRWNGASLLETYTYDGAGQLTNRVDNSGTNGWTFDLRGRVATNSTPLGVLYYAYDANGNLTNLYSATGNGVSVGYQYDALNRMTNVVDKRLTGSTNTAYRFDGVGNLQALKYPNGVTNYYQYDSLNRLMNLTWKLNGAQRGDFSYGLGATGLRTNLSDNVSGTSRTYAWSYDRLYRLTNETAGVSEPTGSLTNWYDGVGNRTNRTGSLGGLSALSNTFDVNDRVDDDGITNNANRNFDANGNTRTNGSGHYWYDWANRLIAYTNGSAWATLVYDADGNRVRKATAAGTNVYLVAGVNPSGYPQVVEEFTVAGGMTNLAKAYTYGLALISQRAPGASTNFFGHDGHGSTRFLLNPAGSTTDTYMYDAFGNLIASNGTPASAYLYCGEQFDSDLGLYYLRARYFNPNTGRFWTMDTYAGDNQNPISMHKYLYCGDDPVNETDPEGQDFMATITTVMNIFTQLGMTPYASEIKAETWARSKIRVNQVGALIAAKARQNLASTKWLRSTAVDNFPAGANKCNKFVADNCNSIGVGDIVPMNFRITPRRRQPYPPAAGDWGNASTKIPGWTVVKDPEPGDIAAQSEFHTDASGHCCIVEKVLPGGRGITIGTSSFIDDQITRTDWGFRSEQSGKVVFKRYTGQ